MWLKEVVAVWLAVAVAENEMEVVGVGGDAEKVEVWDSGSLLDVMSWVCMLLHLACLDTG